MLAFTRKTDYALIALTHLARHSDECNSAREIAQQYGVPLPLLMNILKQMTQQGLAQSVRGPRGGYRLATSPDKITLNDIIRAVEGPVQLVQCVEWYQNKMLGKTKTGCDLMAGCPVRPTIHRVHDKLVQFLSGVTLADVVESGGPHERKGQESAEPLAVVELQGVASVSGESNCEAVNLPG